jgi:hypothetical protein
VSEVRDKRVFWEGLSPKEAWDLYTAAPSIAGPWHEVFSDTQRVEHIYVRTPSNADRVWYRNTAHLGECASVWGPMMEGGFLYSSVGECRRAETADIAKAIADRRLTEDRWVVVDPVLPLGNPIQKLRTRLMMEYPSTQAFQPAFFEVGVDGPPAMPDGWWVLDAFMGAKKETAEHRVFVWRLGMDGIGASISKPNDGIVDCGQFDRLFADEESVIPWVWPSRTTGL